MNDHEQSYFKFCRRESDRDHRDNFCSYLPILPNRKRQIEQQVDVAMQNAIINQFLRINIVAINQQVTLWQS